MEVGASYRHWGTSPRMRGKLYDIVFEVEYARNIPAYAGKTVAYITVTVGDKEHPRVCGENNLAVAAPHHRCGTSPRMRGKLHSTVSVGLSPRNIPAYAGKTGSRKGTGSPAAEHPRVCGENPCMILRRKGLAGTSPRMRGKPHGGGL